MNRIITSKLFIPWLLLGLLFVIVIEIESRAQGACSSKAKRFLVSSIAGMSASALAIGLIYLVATMPTRYDAYDNEVANRISTLPVHTSMDNTVVGVVTQIDEKVVVTANLKVLSNPNNAVFYKERLVNYEIKTEAELVIGDEVAITRGVDGVFKYSGKVLK